jgi:thermostable 8-oxoguanine DNA glycosylase
MASPKKRKKMNLNRRRELEKFILHCIIVAGKTAPFAHAKVASLLSGCPAEDSPFEYLARHDLSALCRKVGTGNYTKMCACITALRKANLDLETCTAEQLEAIPGIGMKTSRYFLMYTRPEVETNDLAIIDTHALKWARNDEWAKIRLAELGVKKIPKSTPGKAAKKLYLQIQKAICEDARRKNVSARNWDSFNWDTLSKFEDISRKQVLHTL